MTDARPPEPKPADDLRWFVLLVRQAGYFMLTEIDRHYGLERPCKRCERVRRGKDEHKEPGAA